MKLYQIYNEDDEVYYDISAHSAEDAADKYAEKYFEREFEVGEDVEITIKIIEIPEDTRILVEEFDGFSKDEIFTFKIWWEISRNIRVRQE